MKKTNLIILLFLFSACQSFQKLEVQEMYCEVVFAYPLDQEIPEKIEKRRVGCACTSKDLIKGVEIGMWERYPLEECRRVRGFSPKQWKGVIDPYFQYQSEKYRID